MRRRLVALPLAFIAAFATLAPAQERPGGDAVQRLRAKLGSLGAALEEIRGEKLTRDVRVEAAPIDTDTTASVDSGSGSSSSEERAARRARALAKLGLVPRTRRHPRPGDSGPSSSEQAVARATEGQTLAWYEPAARTLFVVKHDAGLDASLDATAIHELDHALEDERFDLGAYCRSARGDDPIATDDDAIMARKLVVEGEATYVAAVWEATRKKRLEGLDERLEKRAAQSRAERARVLREQATALGDKAVLAAIESEDALPLYLYRGLVDPYVQGPAIIARVRKHGGWAAVDDLYRNPPVSTRELFRLEKRAVPREATPSLNPAGSLGADWKRTFETTLGEVGVEAFLEGRVPTKRGAPGARLAACVTSDRLAACENAARETCVAWVLLGETEDVARDLEMSLREAIREPWRSDGEPLVERHARRVAIVLGLARADARKVLDDLLGPRAR